MLTLVLFKMVSDLCFYYAFGGFVAFLAGSTGSCFLPLILLQALCGTLSYVLEKRGGARFLPLLLLAVSFVLPGMGLADRIAAVPGCAYVIWAAVKKRYVPDWNAQIDIFQLFWKILLGFSAFMLIMSASRAVITVTIPVGVVGLVCMVLLNRSLRHELSVCSRPAYQAMNLLVAGVFTAAALFLSSKTFLTFCLNVLKGIYNHIISPLLMILVYVVLFVVRIIAWLFSWVKLHVQDADDTWQLDFSEGDELADSLAESQTANGEIFNRIMIVLGIIVAVILLILLFRWLTRHARSGAQEKEAVRQARSAVSGRAARNPFSFAMNPVDQVREQYRKFLRIYHARGLPLEQSRTSAEVEAECRDVFDEEAVRDLKDIYRLARYDGKATKEDVSRAKQLFTKIRDSARDGS